MVSKFTVILLLLVGVSFACFHPAGWAAWLAPDTSTAMPAARNADHRLRIERCEVPDFDNLEYAEEVREDAQELLDSFASENTQPTYSGSLWIVYLARFVSDADFWHCFHLPA